MDWKIAFNVKVALGFLNRIKADPEILSPINHAIARLEDTIALIKQEKRIEKQKHLAFMKKVQEFSKN
jgi:ribosomal protein L19E